MKKDSALGFIETTGLASSIAAADAALKAANVELIGREISKGQGWVTIKITGDVAAVQAAIEAAKAAIAPVSPGMTNVIPRPAEGLGVMVRNSETTLGPGKSAPPAAAVEAVPAEQAPPAEEVQQEEPGETAEQAEPVEPAGDADNGEDFDQGENSENPENTENDSESPKSAGRQNKHGKRKK